LKKIVIFDLDNTFYRYDHSHKAGMLRVFDNQNIFQDFEKFTNAYNQARKISKIPLVNNASSHNRAIYFKKMLDLEHIKKYKLVNTFTNLYWEAFMESAEISKQVKDLIIKNKGKDTQYHLYTNMVTDIQMQKISLWGLDFFDKIVTSEEVGVEKPSEKFIEFVIDDLEKLKELNYSFYAIGDDINNDLKPWKIRFNANTFLVNNDSKSRYVDYSLSLFESLNIIFNN
tara:strand:- start:1013 stop:1696 length:684 start_codon:yes stop_codon:yes gene_type:complete